MKNTLLSYQPKSKKAAIVNLDEENGLKTYSVAYRKLDKHVV